MAVYTGKVNLINMSNISAAVGIQEIKILYAASSNGRVPPNFEENNLTINDNKILNFSSESTKFQLIEGILWAEQDGQIFKLTTNQSNNIVNATGWQTEIPEVGPGQYLWIKTIYYYTNDTQTIAYSVSRQGEDGKQGPAGASASAFKLNCSQTEILKFINSTGNTIIAPGSWTYIIPAW